MNKNTKIFFLIWVFFVNIQFSYNQQLTTLNLDKPTVHENLYIINSRNRETNLCITPDGRFLYFMSDRGGQSWSIKSGTFRGVERYDGDIWFAERINDKWQKPQCLSNKINSSKGEDEPNITPDGQRMYFQSWRDNWETTGGPYYYSTKYGDKWTTPIGLGDSITLFFKRMFYPQLYFATDGMAISPNEKIFIVSCGNDYEGNLDLYIAFRQGDKWTYPKLMNISTKFDERSVFIAADNRTVFFASNAYWGYGGLDIYTCQLDDKGNCNNIRNLGPTINTYKDEYSFIVTADAREVYYVSSGDIVYAKFDKPQPLLSNSTLFNGYILDCDDKPTEAELIIKDNSNNVVLTFKSDANGYFSFVLPDQEAVYQVFINNNFVQTLRLSQQNSTTTQTINLKVCSDQSYSRSADRSRNF